LSNIMLLRCEGRLPPFPSQPRSLDIRTAPTKKRAKLLLVLLYER
jgi:hypothetical protein